MEQEAVAGSGILGELSSGDGAGQQPAVGGQVQGVDSPVGYQGGHPDRSDEVSGGVVAVQPGFDGGVLDARRSLGAP
jgi:hypothetical protein